MKKIVLVGKGASGKNYLMERFEKRGFRHLVSHTTRGMRQNEKEGKEYHFVSEEKFLKMIDSGRMIEYQEFNGNYYGTSVDEWEKSDIVIMARKGIDNLRNLGLRDECFVIFIDIPCHIRKERLYARKMNGDKVDERLNTDEREFEGFKDYDLRITNPDF